MKKMLKRADGSKSQRGLWDNIRAKAASNKKAGKKGKAPSKAMLEQENKIKAEERKMGGNWMQDSKELKFGGMPKEMKYANGGPGDPPVDSAVTKPKTPAFKLDLSSVSFGDGSIAGKDSGGGSKGFDKQCIGKDCMKMMKSKGSSSTNRQNLEGAKGLSDSKQLEPGRVVYQTEEEKQAGLANRNFYAAQGEAKKAQRKAEAAIRNAPPAPIETDFKQVYAVDPNAPFDPNAKQKTGGKRKYVKKY